MKGKKTLIFVVIAILSLVMISAAEPAFYLERAVDANITLHVLNTDNSPATASSNCSLTIKNPMQVVVLNNQQMSFAGNGDFTIFVNGTSVIPNNGLYPVNLDCAQPGDHLSSNFVFQVTPNGERIDIQDAIFYLGLLTIFIVFLVISIANLRNASNFGWFAFYICVSYILLIGVLFVSWQISSNFLTSIPLIGTLFYIFWLMFFWGLLPFLLFLFLYMISQIFNEKELTKLIKMGYTTDEAKRRLKSRRR